MDVPFIQGGPKVRAGFVLCVFQKKKTATIKINKNERILRPTSEVLLGHQHSGAAALKIDGGLWYLACFTVTVFSFVFYLRFP